MNVLAISGSLRTESVNSALLRAAASLAPPGMSVMVFQGLADLPLFNPDRTQSPPNAVVDFQSRVAAADALLIASPEYAHGVTGAIKNALDWLVSFEPFTDKPVAVLNTSARAHHADEALREILKTMSAAIVEPASINIPLLGAKLNDDGSGMPPGVAAAILEALGALHDARNASMVNSAVPSSAPVHPHLGAPP